MTRQELEKIYKKIEDDSFYNGSLKTQNKIYEVLDEYLSDVIGQTPEENKKILTVIKCGVLSLLVCAGDEVRKGKGIC